MSIQIEKHTVHLKKNPIPVWDLFYLFLRLISKEVVPFSVPRAYVLHCGLDSGFQSLAGLHHTQEFPFL